MGTISIYVDAVKHDVTTGNAYGVEELSDILNDYFSSHGIPLEAYWQNTIEPIPPWSDDGQPTETQTTFASFTLKRIPSELRTVNTAAIYDRGIGNMEAWRDSVDINSILMGNRYIDFNNSRNDKDYPENYPPDWLSVGNFSTDYGITAIDVSNLKSVTGNFTQATTVDKTKPYNYDPRIVAQVIKFTSDKTVMIQVNAVSVSSSPQFLSYNGMEWGSNNILEGPDDDSYHTATPGPAWSSINNTSGYFAVRPGKAIWLLITDAKIISTFLPPGRNTDISLICSRFTIFNRSSNVTAVVDPGSLQCVVPINAWGGGYREMFGNYIYNAFWAFIPKHTQERNYSFAYEAARIDIDSLYYFFSDYDNALNNDDDNLVLTKAESVWDPDYSIYRAQITIPANKSMMLFVQGKGYAYSLYATILP